MNDIKIFFAVNVVTGINYSLPIALLTQICYSRDFTETFVGFVFAVYSLSNLATIPFTNNLITKLGRFNLLILISYIRSISSILFISLSFCENQIIFGLIAICARAIQGFSVELINILIFTLASTISDKGESSKNLSYVEMATSLGLILGPLLSFLFGWIGYILPFIISILLDAIVLYYLNFQITTNIIELNRMEDDAEEASIYHNKLNSPLIKGRCHSHIDEVLNYSHFNNPQDTLNKIRKPREKRLFSYTFIQNNKISDYEYDNIDESIITEPSSPIKHSKDMKEIDVNDNVSIFRLLMKKEVILTFSVVLADFICQNFFTPVFTLFMEEKYSVSGMVSSAILSFMYFVYFISLKYIGFFLDNFPAKFLLVSGVFINSISALLMNPVGFFPQKLYISIFSFCLLNFFAGFAAIGSLIDFTNTLKLLGMNDYIANDNASTLYITGKNLAELIGPIIGGTFTHLYNFELASLIVGLINLSVSIIFMIFSYKKLWSSLIHQRNKHK